MQPIIITAFFTNNSIPITTLTPSVYITNVNTGLILVNGDIMTSVGFGQYSYNFTNPEIGGFYTIVCDGGASQSNAERYSYGSCQTPAIELVADFSA